MYFRTLFSGGTLKENISLSIVWTSFSGTLPNDVLTDFLPMLMLTSIVI